MVERALCREEAARYVDALFGSVAGGLLIEVRWRVPSGMRQRFFRAARLTAVVDAVLASAGSTDVFVGVLPRVRRRGRLQDVQRSAAVLWADCDTPASASALASFPLRPSMIVASSAENRHAYWFLREPVDLQTLERLNGRLALALGADAGVVTKPHTILRPAGSANHKHQPPEAVRLIEVREHLLSVEELERRLPRQDAGIVVEQPVCAAERARPAGGSDPLLLVPPAVYFERLTGQRVGRSRKVHCPFHLDRVPSLHVYEEPARGWYCFSCGFGGSIYDLASLILAHETRGREFIELRQGLEALFR